MMSPSSPRARTSEAGFTLVEALVAIVVLAFGLIAVTNLLVVAAASNAVGNHSTAATTAASEVMERLKSRRFTDLVAGGSVTASAGIIANCDETPPPGPDQDCIVPGNFNAARDVPGVGRIQTLWEIVPVDGQTLFIRTRAQSTSPLAGPRSRAEFTSIRSCTAVLNGCPEP